MRRERYWAVIRWAAPTGLLLIALVGVAHTPAAQALYLRATGETCPFGGKSTSPEAFDAQMRAADVALRGEASTPAKPALGFALLSTSRETFEARAQSSGGHCYSRDHGLGLECANMPLAQISGLEGQARGTIWARFDTGNRLRELTAISRADNSDVAARSLHGLYAALVKHVGPPHAQRGEMSSTYLGRGALTQSMVEYRFTDYYAKVSATNMGRGGFRITQQYRSLAN